VDVAWLKAELADGPVAYETLVERAPAAGIPVRGRSTLGWGQATLGDAGQRIRAFVVVPDDGKKKMHWTLRRDGFHVADDIFKSIAQGAGMR